MIKCSILSCENPTGCARVLTERIKIGALGFQEIAIPLCHEHDSKAFAEEYLVSLLTGEKKQ